MGKDRHDQKTGVGIGLGPRSRIRPGSWTLPAEKALYGLGPLQSTMPARDAPKDGARLDPQILPDRNGGICHPPRDPVHHEIGRPKKGPVQVAESLGPT